MARPEAPKKYLKRITLRRAKKIAGGWNELAALVGKSARSLQYYEVEKKAPPDVAEKIERIASGAENV